jgi:hypothetical protein
MIMIIKYTNNPDSHCRPPDVSPCHSNSAGAKSDGGNAWQDNAQTVSTRCLMEEIRPEILSIYAFINNTKNVQVLKNEYNV